MSSPTEPLTDEQLDVLVARLTYRPTLQGPESNPWLTLHNTVDDQERDRFIAAAFTDVPVLLAEVTRLRAELTDEQAAHAKTIDNFEGYSEDTTNTLSALRTELDLARIVGEPLRAAHFREIARLLEAAGRDDDAVNMLDNVAHGIEQYNPAPACTCAAELAHQAGCPSA